VGRHNEYQQHWTCVTDNSGLPTYGLNGLCQGDEHPAYTPSGVWHSFTFLVVLRGLLVVINIFSNKSVIQFRQLAGYDLDCNTSKSRGGLSANVGTLHLLIARRSEESM